MIKTGRVAIELSENMVDFGVVNYLIKQNSKASDTEFDYFAIKQGKYVGVKQNELFKYDEVVSFNRFIKKYHFAQDKNELLNELSNREKFANGLIASQITKSQLTKLVSKYQLNTNNLESIEELMDIYPITLNQDKKQIFITDNLPVVDFDVIKAY